MTRHQQDIVDSLAFRHGGVMVAEGYDDESIRVTLPDLHELRICATGAVRSLGINACREAVEWAGSL